MKSYTDIEQSKKLSEILPLGVLLCDVIPQEFHVSRITENE